MKQYRKIIAVAALLACTLLLEGIGRILSGQLSTQQLAERWSKEEEFTQISCFFAEDSGMQEGMILPLEQNIRTALEEASIDASNENGRTWLHAYSTEGELTLASDRTSMTARAYAVSDDFFLFHPLKLLSGSYMGIDDSENDSIILDENVAWQLFGSYNVSGLTVEIGGTVYVIKGVVRSDSGFFSKAANEETPTVYVSYNIMEEQLGEVLPIDNYELLIANPVDDFGVTTLQKALTIDESQYEMVENSARYGVVARLTALKNFGTRSMSTKAIVYPYWENRARGYEDVSALLLVIEMLCLLYPLFYAGTKIYYAWKKKDEVKNFLKEKIVTFAKKFWLLLKNTVKTYKVVNKRKDD